MTYQLFLKLILRFKKASEELSELNSIGFDFYEGKYKLSDHFYHMLIDSLSITYNEQGVEWVSWFIFENDYATNDKIRAWDKDNNPIAFSFESLYNLLESEYKK